MKTETIELNKILELIAKTWDNNGDVLVHQWKAPIAEWIRAGGDVNALDPTTKIPLFVKVALDQPLVDLMVASNANIHTLGKFGFFEVSAQGLEALMRKGFNPTLFHTKGSFAQQLKAKIVRLSAIEPTVVHVNGTQSHINVEMAKMSVLIRNGVPSNFLLDGSSESAMMFYKIIQEERIRKIQSHNETNFEELERAMRDFKNQNQTGSVYEPINGVEPDPIIEAPDFGYAPEGEDEEGESDDTSHVAPMRPKVVEKGPGYDISDLFE